MKIITHICISLCILGMVGTVHTVSAQGADPLGFGHLDNSEILTTEDPQNVVGGLINVALSVLATILVALVLYAGFLWMTAGGNDDQIKKARKILFTSTVGLVIIFTAMGVTRFIFDAIQSSSAQQRLPG